MKKSFALVCGLIVYIGIIAANLLSELYAEGMGTTAALIGCLACCAASVIAFVTYTSRDHKAHR